MTMDSDRILWKDNTLDELKSLLGEDIQIEFDEDEAFGRLDFPWPITVTDVNVTTDKAGRTWATLTVEFDAVEAGSSYEIRFSLYEETKLVFKSTTWQPDTDGIGTSPTYLSGFFTAAKSNSAEALVFWLTAPSMGSETVSVRARTVSLDSNMNYGTPFTITTLSSQRAESEGMRAYNLSDGRIVLVIPDAYSVGKTDILLLDSAGGLLDQYRETGAEFWISAGALSDDDFLFLLDTNATSVYSYSFSGDTITNVDAAPSGPILTPFIIVSDTHLFVIGTGSYNGPAYGYITRSGGALGTWSTITEMTPTNTYFFPWNEDSYMGAVKTAPDTWVLHGSYKDGSYYTWAAAEMVMSGSTVTIGNVRRFTSPDGDLGTSAYSANYSWTLQSGSGIYQGPIAMNWMIPLANGSIFSLNEIESSTDIANAFYVLQTPISPTSQISAQYAAYETIYPLKIEGLTSSFVDPAGVPIEGDGGVLIVNMWAYDPDDTAIAYIGNCTWVPIT